MRLSIAALAAAALAGALATTAVAQTPASRLAPFPVGKSNGEARTVQISVSYQFFMEGEAGDMAEQAKLSDDGRKHLYRMLARECEVLLDTIAQDCYIKRANVSSQVQNYRRRKEGIRVSGSATYEVTLKPSPASTKTGTPRAAEKPTER